MNVPEAILKKLKNASQPPFSVTSCFVRKIKPDRVQKQYVRKTEYLAHQRVHDADSTLAPRITEYRPDVGAITMELIHGMSLDHAVDVLDAEERDELFRNVVRRIKYLHEKTGFSHRDCHPFNIFVNYQTGLVCFIDFEYAVEIEKIDSQANAELRGQLEYMIDLMELQLWYIDNLRATVPTLTLEIQSLYADMCTSSVSQPKDYIETTLLQQSGFTRRGRVIPIVRIITIQYMVDIFCKSECADALKGLADIMQFGYYRASFQELSKLVPKLNLDSNYHAQMQSLS
jgi:serine/threonine protein kinase